MALIVGTSGTIPVAPESVIDSSNIEYANNQVAILYGVNSPETVITPKPELKPVVPVKFQTATVQTKASFYASTEAELANIPVQGSCFDYVPAMAQKYGVDANLMTRIIKAESGGNPNAKNKNSTASGCAQFIRATWAGTLKQMGREWVTPFNAEANVEAMAFKISRGGIGAWDASAHAWSR